MTTGEGTNKIESTSEPSVAASAAARFEALPALARVETDYFCESCGANLRDSVVRRELATQMLLTRCPACGRFHPAGGVSSIGQLWMTRAVVGLAWAWITFVLLAVVIEGIFQFAMLLAAWEEIANAWWYNSTGSRYRYSYQPDEIFLWSVAAVVMLLGFVTASGARIVFPHWGRWGFMLQAIVRPIIVAALVAFVSFANRGQLVSAWFVIVAATYWVLYGVGSVAGIMAGRPLARLAVVVFLPARFRPVLGYLWTIDGKEAPR